MLAFNFKRRQKTDCIYIHREPKAQSKSVREVNNLARRYGYFALPWHFVVLQDGTIEDGRNVHDLVTQFPTSVRILVLCEGEVSTWEQQVSVNNLIESALLKDFPGAVVRLAL